MDMFIRTNRYFNNKKYELNESELIFIRIGIHTILSLNVYTPEYQCAKVRSLPSKHEFHLRKIKVYELHRKKSGHPTQKVHVRKIRGRSR